jgi:chemotaxis response regulator CheB
MAGGAVCFRSIKQTLVTQSSTEAELVALTEGTNHLVSLRFILGEIGLPMQGPTVVYQDNRSTILLIKNDRTRLQRSKHIDIKYFVARDRVRDGIIEIVYLPSEEMPADVLTKGVDSSTLELLLPKIMLPKNLAT